MAEEGINATGRFEVFNSTDFAASYDSSPGAAGETPVTPARVAAITPPPGATSVAQATAADIQAAVAKANANLADTSRVLDFTIDAQTGISIAMIRDSQTGAVVQQIPGTDIIALAKMLAEWSPGKHMLLDLIA